MDAERLSKHSGGPEMNGLDQGTLIVLCAGFLGGVTISYRGMKGKSDSIAFLGWLIALVAVGIGAAWVFIGHNPIANF
jgi:hypothetical protein